MTDECTNNGCTLEGQSPMAEFSYSLSATPYAMFEISRRSRLKIISTLMVNINEFRAAQEPGTIGHNSAELGRTGQNAAGLGRAGQDSAGPGRTVKTETPQPCRSDHGGRRVV